MEALKSLLGRLDRLQQGHTVLAVAWAVNKKYGDDRGGYLAALVSYYGLLSIFPLMLVFFSVALFVVSPTSEVIVTLDRHLHAFPVIGPSLVSVQNGHLGGSVPAIVLGLAGLVWGGQGLAQVMQHAMNEVWSVPGRERAGYFPRLVITAKWYVAFGLGVVASTYVSSLGAVLNWGPVGPVLAAIPALGINVALFVLSFWLLTPRGIAVRLLVPGAALAGVVWTVLTGVGVGLITHQVNHAQALYSTIGLVIGILTFLYLAARLTLYAAELNAVLARHLWPRSIFPPPLSSADRRQLSDIARREERTPEERVTVQF